MPLVRPPDFDWDEANISHIGRHGVTPAEAEYVIRCGNLRLKSEERSGEGRHAELGETSDGRLLVVVWTWRRRAIRVVTAFPAGRKWRALWKQIRG